MFLSVASTTLPKRLGDQRFVPVVLKGGCQSALERSVSPIFFERTKAPVRRAGNGSEAYSSWTIAAVLIGSSTTTVTEYQTVEVVKLRR